MALIKCEECGQMVSDKAEACPHCGCPVERPLVCPECGQVVEDNHSYCKNCGCPIKPTFEGQSPTSPNQEVAQMDYSWDEEEHGNRRLWLRLTLAALVLIGGTAAWLYWQNGITTLTPEVMDTVAVVEELPVDSTEADVIVDAPAVEEQYAEAEVMEADTYDDSYQNDSYENADIEEVKTWIQGNWRHRMVTEFGPSEMRIGINGDYLVEMINGEMTYHGEYTIDGDCLRCLGKGVSGIIYIDRTHRRLMATEIEPMTRF